MEGIPYQTLRKIFTYGSVGRAPGNRCFYPEADSTKRKKVPRWLPRLKHS